MPKQPSQLSIKQLMREYREGLRLAVSVRRKFGRWSSALTDHLNPQPLTNKLNRRRKSSVVSEPVTLRIPRNVLTRSHTITAANNAYRDPRKQYSGDGWSPFSDATVSHSPPTHMHLPPSQNHPHLSSLSSTFNSQSAPSSPLRLQRSNSDAVTMKNAHRMFVSRDRNKHANQPPILSPTTPKSPHQYITSPRNAETYCNSPNSCQQTGSIFFNQNDPNFLDVSRRASLMSPPSSGSSNSALLTPREYSSSSTSESGMTSAAVLVSASASSPDNLKSEMQERHQKRMEELDANIEKMLKVYLDWLDLYIPVAGSNSSSHHSSVESEVHSHGSVLLQEWQFVTTVCPQVTPLSVIVH